MGQVEDLDWHALEKAQGAGVEKEIVDVAALPQVAREIRAHHAAELEGAAERIAGQTAGERAPEHGPQPAAVREVLERDDGEGAVRAATDEGLLPTQDVAEDERRQSCPG